MLTSASGACQSHAAGAIGNICHNNEPARRQIIELGGLQPLISLLTSSLFHCHLYAAWLQQTAVTAITMAKSRSYSWLDCNSSSSCVASASPKCQQCATWAKAPLSSDKHEAGKQLTKLGVLQPIIKLLASSDTEVQQRPAIAINNICEGDDTAGQEMIELGAMEPLTTLASVADSGI